ncbi:hypothetical protein BN14_08081 [Rhizoctonia solani AG-1 IB]|nr:hypothetical protein BN14_08081 [Rhizoctonia solani AG-1 IB]
MTLPATGEEDYTKELFPPLAAIASVYGDPDGKYAAFLKEKDPNYPGSGYYLIAPGLSDSGLKPPASVINSTTGGTGGSGSSSGNNSNGAMKMGASGVMGVLVALAAGTLASAL